MKEGDLWIRAKDIHLQIFENVGSGFDIGFDKRIPLETQNELRKFVKLVEQNFNIPKLYPSLVKYKKLLYIISILCYT